MHLSEVDTIIFDVDGTLSEEISWLKITECLGADPEEHKRIYGDFKRGVLSYYECKKNVLELWQKTGNATYPYMFEMFHSWDLREDALETIEYLKTSYRLCLISGAVDLYVQIVAEKLGVTDWYANTALVWDKEGNLVDFHYHPNQSQKKLEQFFQYIKEKNITIEQCAIVGDGVSEGESDSDLFQILIGIAMLIGSAPPSEELEALAYCWIRELKELKQIFLSKS